MKIENKNYQFRLNPNNINSLEDIKSIFKVLDLHFKTMVIPEEIEKNKHLWTWLVEQTDEK